jgi:hypothetical protein
MAVTAAITRGGDIPACKISMSACLQHVVSFVEGFQDSARMQGKCSGKPPGELFKKVKKNGLSSAPNVNTNDFKDGQCLIIHGSTFWSGNPDESTEGLWLHNLFIAYADQRSVDEFRPQFESYTKKSFVTACTFHAYQGLGSLATKAFYWEGLLLGHCRSTAVDPSPVSQHFRTSCSELGGSAVR